MTPPSNDIEQIFQERVREIISNEISPRHAVVHAGELELLRAECPNHAKAIDQMLMTTLADIRGGMKQALEAQTELKAELKLMTNPPWRIARVRAVVEEQNTRKAIVQTGQQALLVEISDPEFATSIAAGDSVYLNDAGNVLIGRAPRELFAGGAIAHLERTLSDGRLVVTHHGQEVVVTAAATLDASALEPGDELCWDSEMNLALSAIEPASDERFIASSASGEGSGGGLESVGGQDECMETVYSNLTASLVEPELAEIYGVQTRQTILLYGPPGCGKTTIARAAAREIEKQHGCVCRFFVVKPGEWESQWVGQSQANIRRTFEAMKRAAQGGLVVLFLDEVDSFGRHRGGSAARHADSSTAALLAEIDGFADRGNVAIVSATNRPDLIDSALRERLGQIEVLVQRPDANGARSIFGIHLSENLPVRPNGPASAASREEILEAAISRLYASNSEGAVCTLHFRDGKSRQVYAGELMSGRLIEQICRAAARGAFMRHVGGGARGLMLADMHAATGEAIDRLRTLLTVRNVKEYLTDLPEDIDVIRVERNTGHASRALRYVHAA
ncbi:MAG: AAA family ATPase [Deltaproteobacteria bacterium]|nr:AAA family ATPase [Deltaproteobacteria bacterium]